MQDHVVYKKPPLSNDSDRTTPVNSTLILRERKVCLPSPTAIVSKCRYTALY